MYTALTLDFLSGSLTLSGNMTTGNENQKQMRAVGAQLLPIVKRYPDLQITHVLENITEDGRRFVINQLAHQTTLTFKFNTQGVGTIVLNPNMSLSVGPIAANYQWIVMQLLLNPNRVVLWGPFPCMQEAARWGNAQSEEWQRLRVDVNAMFLDPVAAAKVVGTPATIWAIWHDTHASIGTKPWSAHTDDTDRFNGFVLDSLDLRAPE